MAFKTQRFEAQEIGRSVAQNCSLLYSLSDKPTRKNNMESMENDCAEVATEAAEGKGLPETVRSDRVESGKELEGGEGLSELDERDRVGEFRVSDAEVEASGGEEKNRENLAKDQVEGVRENSAVESNSEEERVVKETERGKESVVEYHAAEKEEAVVSVVVPENHEVEESSTSLTPLSDPPTVSATRDPSLVSRTDRQDQGSLSRIVDGMSVSPAARTPTRDGYNWRKYGQKQVKSPKGSRSYYRCTYSDCCAKKIECCNYSGNVIEVVNRGWHSHEPPRKKNFSVPRVGSSTPPVSEDRPAEEELGYSDPSTSREPSAIPERKRPTGSSVSDGNGEMEAKENHLEEPEAKRRLKKDNTSCLDSVSNPGKKHKLVVHSAGDLGISGDGYRWRKYGQKMVKGNPNPRNYYRCTSAGCPVRKHIETAVDSTNAVVITYKGGHNHDMPVPKKSHGLVAVAAATAAAKSMNSSQTPPPQVASSQCLALAGRESDMSGEALDFGNERAMESARTLLSIGFEIKQC